MNSWDEILEAMAKEGAPPSNPLKMRCSELPTMYYCTEFSQNRKGPEGDNSAATLGKAIHYLAEKGPSADPFDVPDDVAEVLHVIRSGMRQLFEEGWELVAKEQYFENEYVTGNLDLVFRMGDDFLYVDIKSGYKVVDSLSPQMVGGACLLYDNSDAVRVFVGILQPRIKGDFIWKELVSREYAERIVKKCHAATVGINDACQFCDRNADCEEIRNFINKVV